MKPIIVKWDLIAKQDLQNIFDFLKVKAVIAAKKVVSKIVTQTKRIRFIKQHQVDEFVGEPYRRIFSGNYRIVYKIQSETEIRILRVFDTRSNPELFRINF
jgi:plasmid stabilization system protein ParE